MSLLNVGSTDDSCNKQALETECYEELSKANTHLRTTSLEKIAAQKAEIATLNAKTVGNKTSGTTKPANPKVIAPGMYAINSKYIVPQRRTNRETPILLPKKKQVTFQETPKPSPRFIKKPVAPLLKKPKVNVPLSTGIKSATEASKPTTKSNSWIYRKLPAKSTKGEKVEEHIRNLNKNNRVDSHVKRFVSAKNLNAICGACHECLISSNHDNCLVYSVKSMNRKQPKDKNTARTTKKVWRPKVVTSVEPVWKPTTWHFTLYDSYPLTRILEPTIEPIELSLSVSSSIKIPMLSKFVAVTLGMESWFQRNLCYRTASNRESITSVLEEHLPRAGKPVKKGNSQNNIDDKGYWYSGCSWHMTGNISYLSEYEPYDGGYVSFGQGGGKITGKGKQHNASCKTKLVNFVSKPLHTLHMDLFGPTSVSSLNHKWYCLVVTDDFSRGDNGGEFKNKEMNEFCTKKGIKREFSNARTPQQNGVAKRRNRTLIEAARKMISKPFGCHVMILNTLDHLGKFDAKGDEGYIIGYSMSSKAFRVFNKRTKKVEENLHVDFLENKLIEKGAGTSSTNISGTKNVASQAMKKDVSSLRYTALPNCGISNPTSTLKIPPADQMESLTVESEFPTVSSPVLTIFLDTSPITSSGSRLISKGVNSEEETPSLDDALTLSNRFEDTLRVEANLSNMDSSIPASPTPTFRIHKDHPKIARIEAIRLFLAYASFMGFTVYQMDVKSAFLYVIIDEELCREFEALMHDKFQMSAMGELTFFLALQVLQKKDGIFLSHDKYLGDILKKFGSLDVRSMIGSLMYLTASRPDIMFVICACARHQVTPKECHLYTIVATSTTEAEYEAASSGYG
nr:hypothetical protein [Tanacetum cinerariifolium]